MRLGATRIRQRHRGGESASGGEVGIACRGNEHRERLLCVRYVAGEAHHRTRYADAPADEQVLVARFMGSSLPIDDIEATQQRLAALGVQFSGSPERQPWRGWLTTFKDPDGNALQLVQYA